MPKTEARLIKLSICECGFPLLNENIPLGAKYFVDTDLITPSHPKTGYRIICGGCGKENPITAIYVYPRGESHGGMLPIDIFNLNPDETQTTNPPTSEPGSV
jgi:hypothetical protein